MSKLDTDFFLLSNQGSAGVPGGGAGTPFENLKSVSFNGTTSTLSVANAASLDFMGVPFSIAMWLKIASNGVFQGICGKWGVANNLQSWYVETTSGTSTPSGPAGAIFFRVTPAGAGAFQTMVSQTGLAANVWNHIVITFNSNSGDTPVNRVKMYINGSSVTVSVAGDQYQAQTTTGTFHYGDDTTGGVFLNGKIDELILFKNVALSAGEVTTLYNAGVPWNLTGFSQYANAILWHRCGDDPTDDTTTIHDQTSNANNATGTDITISTDVP